MANEIGARARQHRVLGRLEIGHGGGARDSPAFGVHFGAGKNADDSRQRSRGVSLDAVNLRVGVRAAQESRVEHPRHGEIVHVGRDALYQPRVFDALQSLADVSFC